MCKQPVLAFYCSRPLIYEGCHIGFQFHEGNSEFNSEESNSDSNSNDGNSNSIPIPPGLSKANSNSIVCDYPVVLNIDAACAPVPR